MSFSGDLKDIGLSDVLQNVQANRLSGTLSVCDKRRERFLLFETGSLVGFSLGRNKGLGIAEHLLRRELVPPRRLEAAQQRKRNNRRALRVILAEMKVLAEDDFRAAVAELISEQFYELLTVKEATFEFADGPPPPRVFDPEQRAAGVSLEIGPLLMEGARRQDEGERISKVVTSENDVFVLLDGWDDVELGEVSRAVAEHLDGRTDVKTLLQQLAFLRFDVLKSLAELVMTGAARPCNLDEIEAMADEAVAGGDLEGAAVLLRRALEIERNHEPLRQRLVEVLEQLQRFEEASGELAVLGYHAMRAGNIVDGLALYADAVRLHPADLTLHERYVHALEEHGEAVAHKEACLELVRLQWDAGLGERALATLQRARLRRELGTDLDLVDTIADLQAAAGHGEEAAATLRQAADLCGKDDGAVLARLRRALQCTPDDASLARRVADIESGRGRRRLRRRRRVLATTACGVVLGLIAVAGVMELAAGRRMAAVMELSLDELARGEPAVAAGGLRQVYDDYPYTASGRSAGRMVQQMVDAEVATARELLAGDDPAQALRRLRTLVEVVGRADQKRQLQAVVALAEGQSTAVALLQRLERQPTDVEAARALAQLVDPDLTDFWLRHLLDARTAGQMAILDVLRRTDRPEAYGQLGRLYVLQEDEVVHPILRQLLQRADEHRASGNEPLWREVYPWLEEQARTRGRRSLRALQALEWLRGR